MLQFLVLPTLSLSLSLVFCLKIFKFSSFQSKKKRLSTATMLICLFNNHKWEYVNLLRRFIDLQKVYIIYLAAGASCYTITITE